MRLLFGLAIFVAFGIAVAPVSATVAPATVTVTGIVVDAKGDGAPDVDVSIAGVSRSGMYTTRTVASGTTDSAGRFAFYGLQLDGTFRFKAVDQQSALSIEDDRQFTTADAGTTVDIRLQLPPISYAIRSLGTPAPFTKVRVHYATDRQRNGTASDPQKYYLNQRSEPYALRYGYADVSIPETHKRGQMEGIGLGDYLKLEFKPDPDKHIILERVAESDAATFFHDLRADAAQRKTKRVVVYIHGFLNSFEHAARVAAQIKYDLLPVDVAIVLYSWPSHNSLLGYSADIADNDATVATLATFLERTARENGTTKVSVIAHSMGNRALFAALKRVAASRRDRRPIFDQVVMAAPDLPSADVLAKSCSVAALASGMTLYASSHDQALLASMGLWREPRAGLASPLLLAAGIDTIDASGAVTDFLGHSYFSHDVDILSDIQDVLSGRRPPRRHLIDAASGASWEFVASRAQGAAVHGLAKAKRC